MGPRAALPTCSLIIDVHTHLLDGGLYTDDRNPDPIATALESMNEAGVDHCVLSGVGFNEDLEANNRLVQQAIRVYPQRFSGFLGVDPHQQDVTRAIRKAIEEDGFRGIKMHQWLQSFPTNDPVVFPVMELAAEYQVPVLFHSGTPPFTTPSLIADLAVRFPSVPVIIGHMGKTTLFYDCLAALKRIDNLYCDYSGNPLTAVMEWGIRTIGAHKFLHGSDEFGAGPGLRYGIEQILDMSISNVEKTDILGRNAARLLRLEGPLGGTGVGSGVR